MRVAAADRAGHYLPVPTYRVAAATLSFARGAFTFRETFAFAIALASKEGVVIGVFRKFVHEVEAGLTLSLASTFALNVGQC